MPRRLCLVAGVLAAILGSAGGPGAVHAQPRPSFDIRNDPRIVPFIRRLARTRRLDDSLGWFRDPGRRPILAPADMRALSLGPCTAKTTPLSSILPDGKWKSITPDAFGDYGVFVVGHICPGHVDRFPFMVALYLSGGRYHCSGVLVDRRHVLTAKHCVCAAHEARLVAPRSVRFGDGRGPWRGRAAVNGVFFFGQPSCPWRQPERDLALLRLTEPLPADAQGALFAPLTWTYMASRALIVGFGRANDGKSERLNFGGVGLISRFCVERDLFPVETDRPVVTGDTRRYGCTGARETVGISDDMTDTCLGDSGGAMVLTRAAVLEGAGRRSRPDWRLPPPNQALFVSALTSRGIRNLTDCGKGGIYTLIDRHVVDWMRASGAAVRTVTALR